MRYDTLLLDQTAWDLVLDANGNIAMAAPPYSLAQDVATAERTFKGEVYYDTTLGIPYPEDILGHLPPTSVIVQLMNNEALKVPGVVRVNTTISSFQGRSVSGQIPFVDEANTSTVINF